jgi:hypothetical protein
VQGPEVEEAFRVLRAGDLPADARLKCALESLTWRLDEHGEELERDELRGCALFSQARAASSLAIAVSEEVESPHEAIYEAIAAMDPQAPMVQILLKALR